MLKEKAQIVTESLNLSILLSWNCKTPHSTGRPLLFVRHNPKLHGGIADDHLHKNIDNIPLNPPSEKNESDDHSSDENKDD